MALESESHGALGGDGRDGIGDKDKDKHPPKAVCEVLKGQNHESNGSPVKAFSCGCAQCLLWYTVYDLAQVGPDLWETKQEEIQARRLEIYKGALLPVVWSTPSKSGIRLSDWSHWGKSELPYLHIESFLTEKNPALYKWPILDPISGFTGSAESSQKARTWLDRCLKEHKGICATSEDQVPLPKRVLDLQCLPDDGLRLVQDSTEIAPYICLSHCWGDSENHPLQTTSHTISDHKRGIAFSTLPKTFQDATVFVRSLGVRYLWIDSLCIIQDDGDDWRVQASKMADIYQGALLTIAASAAANSTHGLFHRSSQGARGAPLSTLTDNKEHKSVWIRQALPHEEDVLETRGWVFQERILSPRMLHFGRTELTWECLQETICECNSVVPDWRSLKSRTHPLVVRTLSKENIFTVWHHVVHDYARLHLSHEADIFPAISGIAKRLQLVAKSAYIAGLWRDNLFSDLCWCVRRVGEAPLPHRPTTWRAPSFSWASLVLSGGAALDFRLRANESARVYTSVVDAQCVPVGADTTGQLSAAYVQLRGDLIPGSAVEEGCAWSLVVGGVELRLGYDWFLPDYDFNVEGPERVESGEDVFLVRMYREEKDGFVKGVCLVLRRSERGGDGDIAVDVAVYERIGFVTFHLDRAEGDDAPDLYPAYPVQKDVTFRIV